ncbi:hypothetical protein MAPG_01668 [Magnaporthiopsis poae ATCC 64411]|uniref:Uncharacterized protein n=1 Tax=Magnaporthiopsis poae (strain ATCC 64411 / 73-15) TaxID=644358 RepID=A0A0C4DPA8_MAGP6|nr:hypothetical protein MAPG_01668 [Magnaporthiopsis poae ATCC 64411]
MYRAIELAANEELDPPPQRKEPFSTGKAEDDKNIVTQRDSNTRIPRCSGQVSVERIAPTVGCSSTRSCFRAIAQWPSARLNSLFVQAFHSGFTICLQKLSLPMEA